jgi:hypothetical protein
MNKLALMVLGWIVLGVTAQGASFDCGKAQSRNAPLFEITEILFDRGVI